MHSGKNTKLVLRVHSIRNLSAAELLVIDGGGAKPVRPTRASNTIAR